MPIMKIQIIVLSFQFMLMFTQHNDVYLIYSMTHNSERRFVYENENNIISTYRYIKL